MLPRPHRHPRPAFPRAIHRIVRMGVLVVAAGSLAGATASAVPALAGTPQQSTAGAGNVRQLPLSYLRAQANYHHMGYSLAPHAAASVSKNAVPLLKASSSDPLYGLDVSSYQGDVDWSAVASDGAAFAYIKATEGSYYTNPYFAQQYDGSYDVGLVRGAYAFAIPNYSSGATQADYLADNGGAWSADGKTLPAALDIEYNPYSGGECFGLSQSAMRTWISDFVDEYHSRTTRWPVVYSTYDWWNTCTGNWSGLAANDPLWIACYCSTAGTLPAGYSFYTFWQYASSGTFPGDQDVFNGTSARLTALADNT